MSEPTRLNHPWLVAVWPGMGHVAVNAGIYLLSKLDMETFAEFEANDLFDLDQVEVKDGIIQPGRRPRNRFFLWRDPKKRHDLIVFLGEAQPPVGKYAFCRQVVEFARDQGAERVFTFAAMATHMHPEHASRVFAAATDQTNLEEMKRLELTMLADGHIGGLNGVLLGAALDAGLHGACLLGEMPHIFAQLPFPKASLGILEAFSTLAGIALDLTDLAEHAETVERKLGEILSRVEEQYAQGLPEAEEGEEAVPGGEVATEDEAKQESPAAGSKLRARQRIEELFESAAGDRTLAFELKQELDRLGLFAEYEDRFLDLFKKAE